MTLRHRTITSLAIAAALGFGLGASASAQDKTNETTDLPATPHQEEVLKTHPESSVGAQQGIQGNLPKDQEVQGMPATEHEREVLKNEDHKGTDKDD